MIELWLRETPYKSSIPDAEAPARDYSIAAIALKAYTFESERAQNLLKSALNQYWTADDERGRAMAFELALAKWRRQCVSGKGCVTQDGEHARGVTGASTRTVDQPPLFSIRDLRARRVASLELLALAHGENWRTTLARVSPGGGNSASRPGSVSNRGFECAQLTSHKNYQNNRREFHKQIQCPHCF